jgi:hypothetical protein
MKPTRSRWAFLSLVVAVLAASIGWASNAASQAACEQRVALPLAAGPLSGSPFFLDCPEHADDVAAALRTAGATVRVPTNASDSFPRLTLKSHSLIPFVISVDYLWEREGEIGGGATKWFVCFFGRTSEIGEMGHYAT